MERNEHLTQESAEILAVRGTAPVENGTDLIEIIITAM